MNKKYICVSFEGLDTSGKTYLVKVLQDYFSKLGYKVKSFKDFTDNKPIKKSFITEIRNFFLYNTEYDELPKIATPFLITAIRMKMIEDIKAFINEKDSVEIESDKPVIILLDRYIHSTLAYDSDSELDNHQLRNLCVCACDIIKPNLSIFLDITYETYKQRINLRAHKDKIESTLDLKFNDIRARFAESFYEADFMLSEKHVVLDNNNFGNEQKCKDLITGLLLSQEFDRVFDVRV